MAEVLIACGALVEEPDAEPWAHAYRLGQKNKSQPNSFAAKGFRGAHELRSMRQCISFIERVHSRRCTQ